VVDVKIVNILCIYLQNGLVLQPVLDIGKGIIDLALG